MPAQMIGHEGGDEVVAVVIAGLPAQGEGDFGFLAGGLQQLGDGLQVPEGVPRLGVSQLS